ncbi:MAG TPA: GAF domain-containing protein [Jatrophihabitans sp.]|nr:GAF domain-containing protein [Jatrophihabitans sp.]
MAIDETALAASLLSLTGAIRAIEGPPVHRLSARLTAIVGAAAEVLGVDSVGVLLLDETGRLRSVASSAAAAEALERAQQQLGLGPGHDTQAGRRTVVVPDLADVPSYAPLTAEVARLGVRAVLSAPIWCDGAVVGNLNLVRARAGSWTDAEAAAAEAYAGVVGRVLGLVADVWTDGARPAWGRRARDNGGEHRADAR